jgi:hypothetical protein
MGPTIIKSNFSGEDCLYIKDWHFDNGHCVPIFEVFSVNGLNQIIGHIKFNNRNYGDVLYRGQCTLHTSMKPSISRGRVDINPVKKLLREKLFSYTKNENFCKELKISSYPDEAEKTFGKGDSKRDYLVLEAIAQQYGESTHLLDVVDNHWNALWFGLYAYKKSNGYAYYKKRTERGSLSASPYQNLRKLLENNNIDFAQKEVQHLSEIDALTASYTKLRKAMRDKNESEILDELKSLEQWWEEEADYQYLILLAVDDAKSDEGIYYGEDILRVDLRRIVPSTFLRPHAQHSVMIRKSKAESSSDNYDLSNQVVGILKMKIFDVDSWLGNGVLTDKKYYISFSAPR